MHGVRLTVASALAGLSLVVTACGAIPLGSPPASETTTTSQSETPTPEPAPSPPVTPRPPRWVAVPLVDAVTGEKFTLADYAGMPILLQLFAVWSDDCAREQVILSDLRNDDVSMLVVCVDVDKKEDAALLRETWEKRGLSLLVATAPPKLIDPLVAEFGSEVVTPEDVPVVLISPDQTSAQLLLSGIKTKEALAAELAKVR